MKFFGIAFFLSTLIASILAQTAGVTIISPILNSVIKAGENFPITWTVTDPNATTIESITLAYGASNALTPIIANILTNGSVPVSALGYNWTVPTNLLTRQDYAFFMRGNNSHFTYSSYFTIENNNATAQ